MNNTLAAKLFEADLLDIGPQETDTKMVYIKSAVNDLKNSLLRNYAKISQHVRVTLNPVNVPDHSLLDEIQNTLLNHWPALKRTHSKKPIRLLRDIMLLTIQELITDKSGDFPIAPNIIYQVGKNQLFLTS